MRGWRGAGRRSWHNESLQPCVRALGESTGWGEGILRGPASVSAEIGGEQEVEVPGQAVGSSESRRGWVTEKCGGCELGFFRGDASEVGAVGRLAKFSDVGLKTRAIDPSLAPGNFFEAGDLEPLAILDDGDELTGLEE